MQSKNALVDAYLNRRHSDFSWLKSLSRAELIKKINNLDYVPQFKTKCWKQQLVCFLLGAKFNRFMFLLEMGGGKTKCSLDQMTYRKEQGQLKQAIVVVPRLLNLDSWVEATEEHSNLTITAIGSCSNEVKLQMLLDCSTDIAVIDYPGLQAALTLKNGTGKTKQRLNPAAISKVTKKYNFSVLDEIHKLKGFNNTRFSVFKKLLDPMDFVYGLTGTLMGKDPQAVFSQFLLVDQGATFGENIGTFRKAYFRETVNYMGFNEWVFNGKMTQEFHLHMKHRSIRYSEEELEKLPPCTPYPIYLDMEEEQEHYYKNSVEALDSFTGRSSGENATLPYARMRMILAGYLKWVDEDGEHVAPFTKNAKLNALTHLLAKNVKFKNSRFLVFHDYVETGKLIKQHLDAIGISCIWIYGATKNKLDKLREFKEDKSIKVLLANAESASTGIDGLQKHCNVSVFYESPLSPITRRQAIKRIHRPGLEQECFVVDLLLKRTADITIHRNHEEGKLLFDKIVDGKHQKKTLLAMLKQL